MFNLRDRMKGVDPDREYKKVHTAIREKLLAQEVKDLETNLRNQNICRIRFPELPALHEIELTITPQEGLYRDGIFRFHITVPLEYNNVPPQVKCLTRVWHPNINEDGTICLSLLRENSVDDFGWRPTRNLLEVVHGLQSLFGDLMDFDDALNMEAAKQYSSNRGEFSNRVKEYINRFART
ncbi:unnamed protein product, partial [Mesorhabditis belari]|uniref:E2 NEDD8-conjugating enzyme n=1 Tax=Mesorhabditis belari TaxID=2138241 RepID=A0AAF3ET13_9BILA